MNKIPTKKILRELDGWKHRTDNEHELNAIKKFRDMVVEIDTAEQKRIRIKNENKI